MQDFIQRRMRYIFDFEGIEHEFKQAYAYWRDYLKFKIEGGEMYILVEKNLASS